MMTKIHLKLKKKLVYGLNCIQSKEKEKKTLLLIK